VKDAKDADSAIKSSEIDNNKNQIELYKAIFYNFTIEIVKKLS